MSLFLEDLYFIDNNLYVKGFFIVLENYNGMY